MKKFISITLILSLLLSAFSVVTIFAEDALSIVYYENFDEQLMDSPVGWTPIDSKSKSAFYLQRQFAKSGKALKFEEGAAGLYGITSPKIPVKEGEIYSASVFVYTNSGYLAVSLVYYDKDGAAVSSKSISHGTNSWQELVITLEAPKGTSYAQIGLVTYKDYIDDGYYDEITLYKGRKWLYKEQTMDSPVQNEAVPGKLVTPDGADLIYTPYNKEGDMLADFSYAGFYAGKYEIPNSENITIAATIEPSKDKNADDTERIQKVIDEVYENASNDYFKVIKLKTGNYNINEKGLNLKTGIILSGEGQGPSGTILYAYKPQRYNVINIYGAPSVKTGDAHYILDSYIKSGSNTITLSEKDAATYKVGDLIQFNYDATQEWNEAMDMVGFATRYTDDGSWLPGGRNASEERYITAIDGGTLTLDMPFYVSYDSEYSKPYIFKIDDSEKIFHVGVENLRLVSYFNGDADDEEHADVAIMIQNAKNCYIKDVSAKYFIVSCVSITTGSKQITVKNCSYLEPISKNDGSRRYSFGIGVKTQQILIAECYAFSGRHDYTASNPTTGPSVFLNSIADYSNSESETHGYWSTGILYDNIYQVGSNTSGAIGAPQNGAYGSTESFGWTAAGVVIYNCLAPYIVALKPPLTYQNFMIGQWGKYESEQSEVIKNLFRGNHLASYRTSEQEVGTEENYYTHDNTSFVGDAYRESDTAPVEPRSLFRAQLAKRLTDDYRNTKPNAPSITSPRGEKEYELKTTNVVVEGIYERGAEKVTVYIDDVAYDANLDNKTYKFTLPVTLKAGTHKMYATQTINGIEGVKCADRFVIVKQESADNPEYLQGKYEFDKIHEISNDNVISFDEYQKPFADLLPEIITVKIGESLLKTDIDPVEQNGRVLVPMRAIFEAFEAEVSWDDVTKTATSVRGDTVIKVTENNQIANVNGEDKWLDVPATIINGRFVVPVRFISETFGADVGWIDKKRQVTIKGAAPVYITDHGLENEINIYGVTRFGGDQQSSTDVVESMFDNKFDTQWTIGRLPDSIPECVVDLGFTRDIKDMHIAFEVGDQRIYTFDVYVSVDGVNYTAVYEKTNSSGTTLDLEAYPVNAKARYVKLKFYGSNHNKYGQWTNCSELTFTQNK